MEDLSSVGAVAPADATPVTQDSTPAVETSAPETANDAPREEDLDTALAKVFQKATREPPPRADDGKFAQKNPVEATKEPAPVDQPQETEKAEAQEKPAPISEVPISWSAEMKAKFASLPPEVQSYVVQRDKETHEHISRLGTAVKAFEPVGRLLEQHQDTFRAKGMSYEQGMSQLLSAQRALDRDPVSAIAKLANVYGVDLGQIAGQGANPQNTELLRQVSELTQEINALKGTVGSRERAEAQARQASLESAVTEFSKGKADFEELTDDILAQITALRTANPNLSHTQILEKAYESARWANPTVRARILAEQAKEAETKRMEEAKKQAAEAKRAAGVNIKGQARSVPVGDDLDAALKSVWNKNQAA